jgi:hypothetical protein
MSGDPLNPARPWLSRRPGECAFPVAGDGLQTRSCCRPCDSGSYCVAHRRRMRGPAGPSFNELLADLARFTEELS